MRNAGAGTAVRRSAAPPRRCIFRRSSWFALAWACAAVGVEAARAAPLCWTADGRRLAYVVCDGGVPPAVAPLPAATVPAATVPAASTVPAAAPLPAAIVPTATPGELSSPYVLPATRLARAGDPPRAAKWRLRTCAADGSGDQLVYVSERPLGGVAWNPGGDLLGVLALDAAGSRKDPASSSPGTTPSVPGENPAPAEPPDEGGWELLFFRAPGAPAARAGARWEASRRVAAAARAAEWSRTELAWHPREDRIVAGLPGESALVERKDGVWTAVARLSGIAAPAWSPNGRRFACFRRESEGGWRLVFGEEPSRPSTATQIRTPRILAPPTWEGDDALLALQVVMERPREPQWQVRLTLVRCDDPQNDVPVCAIREQSGAPQPGAGGGPETPRREGAVGFAATLERSWFTPLVGRRTTLVYVRQTGFSHRVAKVVRGEAPEPWHPLDPLIPVEAMRAAPDRPRVAGIFGGMAPGEPTVCFLTNLSSSGLLFPQVDASGRLDRAAVLGRVCRRLLERPIEAALSERYPERPPPMRIAGLPTGVGWNAAELARDPGLVRPAARVRDLAERGLEALSGLDFAALPSDARRIEALELRLLFGRLLVDPRFPSWVDARLELAATAPERLEGAALHAAWTSLRGRPAEAAPLLETLRPPLRALAEGTAGAERSGEKAWAAELLRNLDRWPEAFPSSR